MNAYLYSLEPEAYTKELERRLDECFKREQELVKDIIKLKQIVDALYLSKT